MKIPEEKRALRRCSSYGRKILILILRKFVEKAWIGFIGLL
jgi:hypothetical protein